MVQIDFDLARYIAQRKGQVMQRARDGAAYSYSREIKVRRNLMALRPVAFAIEVTSRQWKSAARAKLLESAERAQAGQHERVFRILQRAAQSMALESVPPCYISKVDAPVGAFALGTDDDSVLVVHPSWLEGLSDDELCALLGGTLSYVQNNLVPYATALYYLEHDAFLFVRWIVKPAVMALRGWDRRAHVTSDRAAMVAARSITAAATMLVRTQAGYRGSVPEGAFATDSAIPEGEIRSLVEGNRELADRLHALTVFARTNLYHRLCDIDAEESLTTDQADDLVAERLGH